MGGEPALHLSFGNPNKMVLRSADMTGSEAAAALTFSSVESTALGADPEMIPTTAVRAVKADGPSPSSSWTLPYEMGERESALASMFSLPGTHLAVKVYRDILRRRRSRRWLYSLSNA